MGGANWDMRNNMRPLNVFVGKSCSRSIDGIKQEDILDANASETAGATSTSASAKAPEHVECLSLPTTEWDSENDNFRHDFGISNGSANCNLISTSNIMDFDAFTLSWRPLPGFRSQDISTVKSERTVLGKIIVFIPAVVFSGQSLCTNVNNLLNSCFL
jgi:hypothetical protein